MRRAFAIAASLGVGLVSAMLLATTLDSAARDTARDTDGAPRSQDEGATPEAATPADCEALSKTYSEKIPYEMVYDPERDVLTLYGDGQEFILLPGDRECISASDDVSRAVDHALATHAEMTSDQCASMRDLLDVAGEKDEFTFEGVTWHTSGISEYINEWCTTPPRSGLVTPGQS